MWWAKTKDKAVDVWHTKAMMVDPRKTKITMIWTETSDICENEEDSKTQTLNLEANNPKIIKAPNACNDKDLEAANLYFEAAELNFKTKESNMDKTIDSDESTENFETPKLNIEITEPEAIEAPKAAFSGENVKNALTNLADLESNSETEELYDAKILSTNEFSESLENDQLNPLSMASYVTEAHSPIQSKEDMGEMEQNREAVELVSTEALNTIASSENLTGAELNGTEAVTIYETEDGNFKSMPVEKEPENAMFLRVIEKTRSEWYNDKKFAKIVKKMEKGKKLKRKEFDEVYMRIRNYCQYNN
jgi:hypothetical protein